MRNMLTKELMPEKKGGGGNIVDISQPTVKISAI